MLDPGELAAELQQFVKDQTAPYKYPRHVGSRGAPEDDLGQDPPRGSEGASCMTDPLVATFRGDLVADLMVRRPKIFDARSTVSDHRGQLLGLLCLKRNGAGFCSDGGIASRAASRAFLVGAGPSAVSGGAPHAAN